MTIKSITIQPNIQSGLPEGHLKIYRKIETRYWFSDKGKEAMGIVLGSEKTLCNYVSIDLNDLGEQGALSFQIIEVRIRGKARERERGREVEKTQNFDT